MVGDTAVSDLAVVIPTRDRWDILRRTLAALEAQTVLGFETIVVVDGKDQRPPPLANVRLIEQPERRGPGAARNRAARQVERPLLLFLGDDMVPTPNLVSLHLAQHEKHPEESSAVLGLVKPHPDVAQSRLDRWIERSGLQFDFANIEGDDAGWGRFYSCNVSLKRKFFLDAGGFDEEFVFDYEDLDLAWRLHERGLRLWFERDAVAHHVHVYDLERLARRFESRARGERLMSTKHEWFRPFYRDIVRSAAGHRRTSRVWPVVADRSPNAVAGLRRIADERAGRWYHQQVAPRFLAVWDGEPEQVDLETYLGADFDPALLHGHTAALDLESSHAPDEATFYRTSTMYLYDLTAFAMSGTKRPYLNDLRRFLPRDATVLDYGCGIGSDGLQLLDEGYRVSFADFDNPSTDYLRWRLARRGADAAVYDLDRDEIPSGFDAAFSLDVIEHVDDPFEFLSRLEKRASVVMVNFLESEPDDTHLHRPLPIKALLDHAARLGILRYRRYHGRSHLVVYRTRPPALRGRLRSRLQRHLGPHLASTV
jgi:GT2 family glycosyltransferase